MKEFFTCFAISVVVLALMVGAVCLCCLWVDRYL
jgi:hypothetical protein